MNCDKNIDSIVFLKNAEDEKSASNENLFKQIVELRKQVESMTPAFCVNS
jgi:hypothetical protein